MPVGVTPSTITLVRVLEQCIWMVTRLKGAALMEEISGLVRRDQRTTSSFHQARVKSETRQQLRAVFSPLLAVLAP